MEIELLVNLFFQNLGGWLESLMQAFTFLGNELFFLLIMPALYWSIDPATGFRAGMMLIISGGLNSSLKMLFHSPRPYWIDPQVKAMASETSFGLPSGHSQNSAAIWGMIAASFRKKWAWSVALVVIFLVGISRLYLGVHFLRDVLSGWLIGGLIVILYLVLEAPVSRWLSTRPCWMHTRASWASKSAAARKRTSLVATTGQSASAARRTAAARCSSSPGRPVRTSSM